MIFGQIILRGYDNFWPFGGEFIEGSVLIFLFTSTKTASKSDQKQNKVGTMRIDSVINLKKKLQ